VSPAPETLELAAAVLAKAAAQDPGMPRPNGVTIAAWAEHFSHIRIEDALDAVAAHYHSSTERLMPADVLRIARSTERARTETDHSRVLLAGVSIAGVDPHHGQNSSPELEELHRNVECVRCEQCRAGLAERCTARNGQATRIPHLVRIAAARRIGVDLGCGVCDAGPGAPCGSLDRDGMRVTHPAGHRRVTHSADPVIQENR